MIDLGKYLTAKLLEKKPKTKIYGIYDKEETLLGKVKYYAPWRQYCFFPESEVWFSYACMLEVLTFLADLKEGTVDEKSF